MIKDNQQHFNRLHVIIDAFVIVVSYILAWWLKFSSGILDLSLIHISEPTRPY